ncbi:MAG: hypothetical protein JW976_02225 [Syntrophaceae bacterium]|nr:hypothetical protein [Syntrophaceae bacterium]
MKIRPVNSIVIYLFATIALLCTPHLASAQGIVDNEPLLMIKIPDINRLLTDAQAMTPATPGANPVGQIQAIRIMLYGTDWIDTNRSIVIGQRKEGTKFSMIALIPFNEPNSSFENAYHPIPGGDYYLMTMPPKPGLTVSPDFEKSLVNASRTPTTRGDLVLEIAASKALTDVEPKILDSLDKAAAMQVNQPVKSPISPENIKAMVKELLNIGKQTDIFRLGLDFSQNFLTLNTDIDAMPGTELANALVDVGGSTRLANLPIDMPIRAYTRPYNIPGIMNLYGKIYQALYSQLGINLQDIDRMTKISTGESAGGFNITSEGIDMETVSALKPGTDGGSFIINEYVPFLEQYIQAFSNIAAQKTDTPATPIFVRTDDSTVAGAKVIGYKIDISSSLPPDAKFPINLKMNFRIAAVKDLMFTASNDASLAELINSTRNLVPSPASGPTGIVVIDTAAFFKGLISLMPPNVSPPPFPLDLGEIEAKFTFSNGKMESETRLDAAALNKISMAIAARAMAAKQNTAPPPAPAQ